MTNIFETPWLLIIIAVSLLFIILILNAVFTPKKQKLYLLIPLIIAASAFPLDHFFKTDSEKITTTINKAVQAVEDENPQALIPLIGENYKDNFHFNKKHFISHATARLTPPLVEKNIWTYLDKGLEINSNLATANISVRIILDPKSQVNYVKVMFVKAQLTLEKQNSNWLITKAQLIELNRQPVNWQKIGY